jgi:5'-3' exoribonuclease 2
MTGCIIFFQFKPLEQLMGVFPAASKKHIPLTWQTLMFDPVSK